MLSKTYTFLVICSLWAITGGMTLPEKLTPTNLGYEVAPECDPNLTTEIFNREVEGWGPNVSRNMNDYILPDTNTNILSPGHLCSDKTELFIFILSAMNHFEHRKAIRSSWGNIELMDYFLKDKVKFAFVLGNSPNSTLNKIIQKESEKHNDIIQEEFIDSYNNLTLKVAMSMKWVLSNCPSTKFVLKSDDDNFVNLPNILDHLDPLPEKKNLLLGHRRGQRTPYRNVSKKWDMPCYMYKYNLYPAFTIGWGYIMSFDVMKKMYEVALGMAFVYLEDIFYTGMVAEKADIERTHDHGFFHKYKKIHDFCDAKDLEIANHLEPANITAAWADVLSIKCVNYKKNVPTGL